MSSKDVLEKILHRSCNIPSCARHCEGFGHGVPSRTRIQSPQPTLTRPALGQILPAQSELRSSLCIDLFCSTLSDVRRCRESQREIRGEMCEVRESRSEVKLTSTDRPWGIPQPPAVLPFSQSSGIYSTSNLKDSSQCHLNTSSAWKAWQV